MKGVLADDLVARVEALRPAVFAQRVRGPSRSAYSSAVRSRRGPRPPPLVSAQNVEALDLAVARCDVGGRWGGAGGHIADESVGERGRGFLPGGAGQAAWGYERWGRWRKRSPGVQEAFVR